MNQRIFHGQISPKQAAEAVTSHFNRGNFQVQQIGSGDQVVVQIATQQFRSSGGQTALSVTIRQVEDGISVQIGKQAWLGIAASLGETAIRAIRNPFSLLNRLDDLAQDIESMRLTDEVWEVIEQFCGTVGSGHLLSERLRRVVCEYCLVANPIGSSSCLACGAPLGGSQPLTCRRCGFVLDKSDTICPNCKSTLYS